MATMNQNSSFLKIVSHAVRANNFPKFNRLFGSYLFNASSNCAVAAITCAARAKPASDEALWPLDGLILRGLFSLMSFFPAYSLDISEDTPLLLYTFRPRLRDCSFLIDAIKIFQLTKQRSSVVI